MQPVNKSVAQVRPVDSEDPNGEFELVLADDSKDRDGERLWADEWQDPLPDKLHFDSDHAWAKGQSVPLTVGSGKPHIDENGRLIVKGTFAGTEHGQLVRQLVNEGHLWQASVSFIDHKRPGGLTERELLNGTFTGVPSNTNAVVISSKSFRSGGTMNMFEAKLKELESEFGAKVMRGECTEEQANEYERRWEQLNAQAKSKARANQFSGGPSDDGGNPDPNVRQQQPAPYQDYKFKGMLNEHGKNPFAPSPLHASQEQWASLFEACEAQMPSFAVNLKAFGGQNPRDTFASGARMKAPNFSLEGTPGSLLPPQLIPAAFPLLMEPTRVFSHLPGMPMDSQWIQYIQHSANTNPAAVTAEVVALPDLGMTFTPKTAVAQKLGATAAISRELLDDFSNFVSAIPEQMARALWDAESNFVLNHPTLGILATSGILTRNANTSANAIDAILAGINDIRVASSAFSQADLLIIHPTTWLDIRTIRTTTGAFVLRQNEPMDVLGEGLDNFFNVPVVQTTQCPQSVAIVMNRTDAIIGFTRQGPELMVNTTGDAVFATYAWQWRIAERITIAIPRPSAICAITALPSYSGGAS
jgi:HK97 family phage major capsid protein